jgi:hypothetical protein
MELSTTTTERVECSMCGCALEGADAVDRWNNRPARLPSHVAMGIYERLRAKRGQAGEISTGEAFAVIELATAVAAAITPDENAEAVNVGVGLWVHGEPEAAKVLRERLHVDPDEQVAEPLALIHAAEQAGFVFDGNTYRCGLPDIAKLVAATKGAT